MLPLHINVKLTICDTKGGSGGSQVILQLVIQKAEDQNQDVNENKGEEEYSSSTLIDHPNLELLHAILRVRGTRRLDGGGSSFH